MAVVMMEGGGEEDAEERFVGQQQQQQQHSIDPRLDSASSLVHSPAHLHNPQSRLGGHSLVYTP